MKGGTRDRTVPSDTTTITLPIPPDALIVIALAFAILFGSYIIVSILPRDPDRHFKSPLRRVAEGLGFRVDTADQAAVLFTAMLGYLLLFAFAMVIAFRMLGGMAIGPLTGGEASPDQGTSLGFGALLAAILGAPFIIWRSWIAAKQAAIAEEALFNDKINAAATDLAARRQVTKGVAPGGSYEKHQDFWEDDLVTRAAAIDRLEGLALEAMERGDFAPAQRIARMLSIYLQELSRDYPAKEAPAFQSRERMRDWTVTLRPVSRPDMERAAQSLGRINPGDEAKRVAFDPRNIDLRRCNLQGFDLSGLNLKGAQLDEAWMQGASLSGAKLQTATLRNARMQAADLSAAEMQKANLEGAQLQATRLRATQMQGARLLKADLRGAGLIDVQMTGAVFGKRRDDDPESHVLRGSALWFVKKPTLEALKPHWNDVILFAKSLPSAHPDHWVEVTDTFTSDDFITQWRTWASTLDPPVTIAPDYYPD
jgi:hypothetical protein